MTNYEEKPDGVQISTLPKQNSSAITPANWNNLNFSELLEQKNILIRRFDAFAENGNKEAASMVNDGINKLDELIKQKSKGMF